MGDGESEGEVCVGERGGEGSLIVCADAQGAVQGEVEAPGCHGKGIVQAGQRRTLRK